VRGEPRSGPDRFGRLDQRVAVVTGAGSGIGRAVAVELAAAGAQVLVTSRTHEPALETAALAGRAGGDACEALAVDVTNQAERRLLADHLRAGPGRVDVLVANAGIDLDREPGVEELSDGEWDTVLETNLSSVFRLVRDLLPMMRAGASIVTVGSATSLIGRAYAAAYVASKGGLLQLTRALAVELAPRGVRANCVCPGNIDTPLTTRFASAAEDPAAALAAYAGEAPMGRLGTAAEVARCVRFLASDSASFVTGAALVADGGMTVS
jgi:NAD(P)-dependent dehydrogenase (short-subunit alcohol dehydrogenase family)